MTFKKILVGIAGGIMTVTLNRPEKLNAIDNELARELLDAIAEAARDEQVRVLLLRGAGRAFCAGRDVSAPPTDQDLELVQAVAVALVALPKPVVAAVHGWTLGAGLEWMLDADLVVAAQSSRFRLPEAALGSGVPSKPRARPRRRFKARPRSCRLLPQRVGEISQDRSLSPVRLMHRRYGYLVPFTSAAMRASISSAPLAPNQ
jgi:hypothetical protein